MHLPTLRLPIASTSSLEFLGVTVSFCWTGWDPVCCWVCCWAGGGGVFAGSWLGGSCVWGAAKAEPATRALTSPGFRVFRRIFCIYVTSAYQVSYTLSG